MPSHISILFLIIINVLPATAAELRLPRLFSDHAVLQRDCAVPVWGWAAPGETVVIEFAGQRHSAVTASDGRWRIRLDPMSASSDGRPLTVRKVDGSVPHIISDVLVGEVWLASGQSNMGTPVSSAHNAAETLASSADDGLRIFTVKRATDAVARADVDGAWEAATPGSAKAFSAVAYFSARELRSRLRCPVAVIHASWGGTPAQCWVGIDSLRQEPAFTKYVSQWDSALMRHRQVAGDPSVMDSYRNDLERWQTDIGRAHNAALKAWLANPTVGRRPTPALPEPANPDPMGMPSPSARPSTPAVIANAMIAPLAPYALRGVWWYQGEANGGAGMEYRRLLPRLIGDWRRRWGQGDFPFLIVQLAGWDHGSLPPEQHDWPYLREAQLLTAGSIPNTALVVTIDIGNPRDVHPSNKLDVGLRLALAARRVAYGEDIVYRGPLLKDQHRDGNVLRLRFSDIGGGLVAREAPWRPEGVEALPTDRLVGFTISGANKKWISADARIENDCVLVSNPEVPEPIAVRYGWANAPRCNLYNREGLPASPFRTDDWDHGPAAGP